MKRKHRIIFIPSGLALLLLSVAVLLPACSALNLDMPGRPLNKGYIDNELGYVPKRPNYRLKDKKEGVFPADLDTVGIYRRVSSLIDGAEPAWDKYREYYLKFYPDGRCVYLRFFLTQ